MVDLRLLDYVRTLHPLEGETPVAEWGLRHVVRQLSAATPGERWDGLSRYANRTTVPASPGSEDWPLKAKAKAKAKARPSWSDLFECPACGQRQSQYRQLQTRGADEPMAIFAVCRCGHRWKEQD